MKCFSNPYWSCMFKCCLTCSLKCFSLICSMIYHSSNFTLSLISWKNLALRLLSHDKDFQMYVSTYSEENIHTRIDHQPILFEEYLSQLMRLWYLSQRQPAKVQASLHIRAVSVSPEPSLVAHLKYGSRRRVRPNIKHLALLDGCTCTFEEWVYRGWKVPYLMRWLISDNGMLNKETTDKHEWNNELKQGSEIMNDNKTKIMESVK